MSTTQILNNSLETIHARVGSRPSVDRITLATHEAGHCLLGLRCGFLPMLAELGRDKGVAQFGIGVPPSDPTAARAWVRRIIAYCAAGAAAERFLRLGASGHRPAMSPSDRALITRSIERVRGAIGAGRTLDAPRELQAGLRMADAVLVDHRDELDRLAYELLQRGRLSGPEITRYGTRHGYPNA